jgi:hypothetical protein
MDPDKEVLNTSQNILDNEEPKFYRQVISRPNADLWQALSRLKWMLFGITILGM